MDPARPNKAQYIAAVPPADVEMTDADKDGDWMAVGWVDGLVG